MHGNSPHKVILIGASAGGIETLRQLFSGLPADLAATIAVVIHRSPTHESQLAAVLQRSCPMPIIEPDGPLPIESGIVFLAPRDRHLLMRDHYIAPVRGPKESFSRPAVDALFRSGAAAHGKHAIGVVLSGWGSDGVAGLIAIKRAGGVAIVQDPQQARAPIMPFNAVARDHVDWVVTVEQMPELLLQLVQAEAVDDRSPA